MASIDSYKRFVANEPEAQIEYRTIEIFHPFLAYVYRFVSDSESQNLKLEAGAPRNQQQIVVFEAANIVIEEPSDRNDNDQVLSVRFGTLDGKAHEIVDSITGSGYLTSLEVVYRKYHSGDTTEPSSPPLYLTASSVSFNGYNAGELQAEDADLANRRPGAIYTVEKFQGLG